MDDYSHVVKLVGAASPDAATVAKALTSWFSPNRVVGQWVSDQGSHFKNKTVEELQRILKTNHHFVTAYTPWANGTVERVNQDLIAVFKDTIKERGTSIEEWPDLLTLVDSLGGKSPVEIHSGVFWKRQSKEKSIIATASLSTETPSSIEPDLHWTGFEAPLLSSGHGPQSSIEAPYRVRRAV